MNFGNDWFKVNTRGHTTEELSHPDKFFRFDFAELFCGVITENSAYAGRCYAEIGRKLPLRPMPFALEFRSEPISNLLSLIKHIWDFGDNRKFCYSEDRKNRLT